MYSNILIPVAVGDDTDFDTPLKVARGLGSDSARITFLHVFDAIPAYVAQQVPESVLENNRAEVRASMEAVASSVPGARVALLDGSPGRAISDYVTSEGIDLVVMASHRPGMGDILWGSTAGFVVRHVPCAVHVLR